MAKKKKSKSSQSGLSMLSSQIIKSEKARELKEAKEKFKQLTPEQIKEKAQDIRVRQTIERVGGKLEKALKKKVVSKRILKKEQITVRIKQAEPTSILGDPNRFFKDEFEEARKQLFFR